MPSQPGPVFGLGFWRQRLLELEMNIQVMCSSLESVTPTAGKGELTARDVGGGQSGHCQNAHHVPDTVLRPRR